VRVLAASNATADDVVRHAGVARERVVVISLAPSERFQPHSDPSAALREAQSAVPRLRKGFIFYPGGMDRRKNIVRLLDAYAGLPDGLRRRHQLVVACYLTPHNRAEVDRMLEDFGVAEDVLFPGYVTDENLVLLYQSATLSVFPSLYEGYGLPVAEAIACATPVIASRTSSIPELIEDEEALFDPYDPHSIREKLSRALAEPSFLERLREARLPRRHSWPQAARDTAAAYASASRHRHSVPRRRPALAVIAGLPSDPKAARETFNLLGALGRRGRIDAFGDTKALYLPPGVHAQRLAQFDLVERARGGYDAILSILGDGVEDVGAVAVAKARGGHLLLRGGLTRVYARLARDRPDLEPRGFDGAIRAMYRDRLAPRFAGGGELTPRDADRLGLLMTAEVVAKSAAVFVQSAYGKQLVEIDAGASHGGKIAVLPLAFPDPGREDDAREALVVARLAGGERDADSLFEALASLAAETQDLRFAIVVAPRGRRPRRSLGRLADAFAIRSRLVAVSERDHARWRGFVRRAAAAVYVADTQELAISPFLGECLSAGVPTVSLQVGAVRELPDDALIKLPPDPGSEVIARNVRALLRHESPPVGAAAPAYARANTADRLAESLYDQIFG
jgi:glycosyltransferase involved in cell wall biosynthesis